MDASNNLLLRRSPYGFYHLPQLTYLALTFALYYALYYWWEAKSWKEIAEHRADALEAADLEISMAKSTIIRITRDHVACSFKYGFDVTESALNLCGREYDMYVKDDWDE